MELFAKFKFWSNSTAAATAGGDASSDGDCFTNSSENSNDDKTDDEDSFFDLVFESPDCNSKLQSPIAPKFKVFTLGSKKSPKCDKTEIDSDLVNCKVERFQVCSNFTRDKSLRSRLLGETRDESPMYAPSKQSSMDNIVVPKYLKLIKSLHIKASKRKNWIMNFTDSEIPASSPARSQGIFSPVKFSDGRRVGSFVNRRLTKSRSASTAVGITPPAVNRRDDSLLQQHDGIEGAILHCKKSFNSPCKEFLRSVSYSSDEKLIQPQRSSCEDQKRCSI